MSGRVNARAYISDLASCLTLTAAMRKIISRSQPHRRGFLASRNSEFPLDGLADEIHADFRFLKNGSDALKRPLRELHGCSLMPQLFAPHAGRNNQFRAHCHFVGLYVLTGIVGPNI